MFRLLPALIALGFCLSSVSVQPALSAASYTLEEVDDGYLLKTPDERPVFRYVTQRPDVPEYTANSACFLYPVYTPSGEEVVDLAPDDHRHHRGIFLAFQSITTLRGRAEFWGWGEFAPTQGRVIENVSIELAEADAWSGTIAVANAWKIKDRIILREDTRVTASESEQGYVLDFHFILTAQTDLTIDRSPFGGFCVKSRKDGERLFQDRDGPVTVERPRFFNLDSTWRGPWFSYTLKPESGDLLGIAVISHSDNPSTGWYNDPRNGMFNPAACAIDDIELDQDETLELKYRVIVHDGEPDLAQFDDVADDWR